MRIENQITAAGKHVIIVGGGDTGADCYGTALRQGALSVTQFQIHPEPPERQARAEPLVARAREPAPVVARP